MIDEVMQRIPENEGIRIEGDMNKYISKNIIY